MGFDVHLVANETAFNYSEKRRKDFYDYCHSHQITLHHLDIPRSPYRLISLVKSYFQLMDLLKKQNVTLIHSHTPVGGLLGRLAAKKLSIKSIYTAHGFHFFKGAPLLNWLIYYPIEKWLSRYTDGIIAINHEDYDVVKSWKWVKSYYIPGVGIETDRFGSKQDDKNFLPIKFISIGELNKNKNLAYVIKHVADLNMPFEYSIAGRGLLTEAYTALIEDSGQSEKIKLLGFIDDIPKLLSSQDIFVMPSLREGLPVALMEAMAAGLPILASDIRGIRDLVVKDLGGFLFDLRKPSEFIDKLTILIDNPDLRAQMSQHNQKKAKDYDITKIREQMKLIYSQFLEEI